jgi:hypothetical protein
MEEWKKLFKRIEKGEIMLDHKSFSILYEQYKEDKKENAKEEK